jgi:FAD/FMN-containing dehydrogenase
MWHDFYHLIVGDGEGHAPPLDSTHAFYVLLESTGGSENGDRERFETALEEAFEAGVLADAVIAQSEQQGEDLWAIRDDIEGLVQKLNPPLAFDVSLGIPQMDRYVHDVRHALTSLWPAARMVTFGHLGDGNIHLVLSIGSVEPADVHRVERVVYETLGRRKGIISAEHGIGLDKRPYLGQSRSAEEIALMRRLKQALDPKNILNPGKIIDISEVKTP